MGAITTEMLGQHVVTSDKLAASLTIPTLATTTLSIGGTAITATAAQLNGVCTLFDVTLTATQVKAGTAVIVPAVTGKQFFPTYAAMCAAGSVTTATVIRLLESTSSGVVLSHVAADLTDGVWAGPTGGTVVTTKLNTACTISEGLTAVDVSKGSLTVTTAIRFIVAGYYI